MPDIPTVDDIRDYDPSRLASWEDEAVQSALDAETAAQASRCRVTPLYPADLAEALKRRVLRNLAMRQHPLAMQFGEGGAAYLSGNDPEVKRLEGPYRRSVIG